MKAGSLRHRVDVIYPHTTIDPDTGIDRTVWRYKYTKVPAAFRALSAREMIAATQRQSQVTSEFEIRASYDMQPEYMIVFNGRLWDAEPPQPDPTAMIYQKIRAYDKSPLQDIEIDET